MDIFFPDSANVAPKFFTSSALNKLVNTTLLSLHSFKSFTLYKYSYLSFKERGTNEISPFFSDNFIDFI